MLFQRYFKSIFGYADKYTRDKAIAEELAMDVMLRLWQNKTNIAVDTNLSAYLFKSIKNALVDHWRKKELQTMPLMEAEISHQARPADYELRSRDMEQLYLQTVDALSPQCRQIFRMSREEEMTYPQIAEKMNLSVNTVKGHMVSALKGMRLKLAHHADLSTIYILAFLSLLF